MPAASVHRVLVDQMGPELARLLPVLRRRPVGGRVDRPGARGRLERRTAGRGQGAVPRRRRGAALRPQPAGPAGPAVRRRLPRPRRQPAAQGAQGPGRRGARLPRSRPRSQQAFAQAFAGDPDILVAPVVAYTPRVLVSEWIEGIPLSVIIREGTQEQRDRAGLLLLRFLFSGPGRARLLHADPHPGNFRLHARRPARRHRLRRRQPAARRAAGADRPAVPARPAGRRRGRLRGPARRGLRQGRRRRRRRGGARLPAADPRAAAARDVHLQPGVAAPGGAAPGRPALPARCSAASSTCRRTTC